MKIESPPLFSDDEFESQVLPETILADNVIFGLSELYDLTDWRSVIIDGGIDSEYDGIPIANYFKALALPYLINIPPSERALGRIILERSSLQKLCGFRVGHPSKKDSVYIELGEHSFGERTFWHFRNKYKEIYSERIIKVLISLVLSGKSPNTNLPFVQKIAENEFQSNGNLHEWVIDEYRPGVTISLPWTEKDLSSQKDRERFESWNKLWKEKLKQCKDLGEYRKMIGKYQSEYKGYARRAKKGFTEEITFPIDVSTTLASGEKLFFRLSTPNWLNKNSYLEHISFNLAGAGKTPLQKSKYDKACNVLVIREIKGEQEILLSRRRTEGFGERHFALPGGKQQEGETLEQCAKRELEEETGLKIIKSKPVSFFLTLREMKQIVSVGVLVESWEGEPETKEPSKHFGWEWHQLGNLPSPIFDFTQIAIDQFVEGKYPNLTWDDLEEKPDIQLRLLPD